MWSNGSEEENELVAIRRQRTDRSRTNYSEMVSSYEYNERLSLTRVKMEERFSTGKPSEVALGVRSNYYK